MRMVVLFLSIAGLAAAQADSAKIAVVDEILAAQHAEDILKQMFTQMQTMLDQQLKPMLDKQVPAGADRAEMPGDIMDFQHQIMGVVASRMTMDRFRPLMEKIYVEEFSLEELQGIRDFQKSPAGQALLRKQPVIMSRSMSAGQEMMKDVLPDIMRMTQEWTEKMKKKYGGQ